jgi:hypothetical protein
VRLEAVRLGGRWLTSREALQRIAERLTPGQQHLPRTHTARARSCRRAERELDELGL